MEGGSKMKCSKCGSTEYSIHLGFTLDSSDSGTKYHHQSVECDNCGHHWKWE